MKTEAETEYADLIGRPYPVPGTRRRMSPIERAAQFSPFAALTGFGASLDETARLTAARPVLTEEEKRRLDEALSVLRAQPGRRAQFEYFVPDEHKEGGRLVRITAALRAADPSRRRLILADEASTEIPADDITDIRPEPSDPE
ncbi:MAG: hypothetical protein ILP12_04570 [Lachnospiraceae bacterium]|nr:hypothetical protein [Lachnospiraceae bacterium]